MTLRVVLADQSQARFFEAANSYCLAQRDAALEPVGHLADPLAHLHDRDFKSDRPGRVFDNAPLRSGRRVATAHHGVGADRRPRSHEAVLFARRIIEVLERAQQQAQFGELVLVAEPHFLGLLRAALPASLRAALIAEIHKNLLHVPRHELMTHLAAALPVSAVEATAVGLSS